MIEGLMRREEFVKMSIAIEIGQPLGKEDSVVLTEASVRNIIRKGNKRLQRRCGRQMNGQTHHSVKTHLPFAGQLPRQGDSGVLLKGSEIRNVVRCMSFTRST